MKISDLIEELTDVLELHGDLDCEKWSRSGDRVPQPSPVLDYRAILKPRESVPRFACEYRYNDPAFEARKGEPVCRL